LRHAEFLGSSGDPRRLQEVAGLRHSVASGSDARARWNRPRPQSLEPPAPRLSVSSLERRTGGVDGHAPRQPGPLPADARAERPGDAAFVELIDELSRRPT